MPVLPDDVVARQCDPALAVAFVAERRGFVRRATNKVVRGLHRHLSQRLWPLYGGQMAVRQRKRTALVQSGAVRGLAGGGSDFEVGSRVDTELACIVAGTPPPETRTKGGQVRTGLAAYHLWTRNAVKCMAEAGLEMCCTQVAVYNPHQDVASSVDGLAYHAKSGRWYVIEVKSGCDNGSRARSFGSLPYPLDHMRINPYSQRHVQAAWYMAVLRAVYAFDALAGAFVLVTNGKGAHLEALDANLAPHGKWLAGLPAALELTHLDPGDPEAAPKPKPKSKSKAGAVKRDRTLAAALDDEWAEDVRATNSKQGKRKSATAEDAKSTALVFWREWADNKEGRGL